MFKKSMLLVILTSILCSSLQASELGWWGNLKNKFKNTKDIVTSNLATHKGKTSIATGLVLMYILAKDKSSVHKVILNSLKSCFDNLSYCSSLIKEALTEILTEIIKNKSMVYQEIVNLLKSSPNILLEFINYIINGIRKNYFTSAFCGTGLTYYLLSSEEDRKKIENSSYSSLFINTIIIISILEGKIQK